MSSDALWNHETPVRDLGVDVPAWIDQDIDGSTVAAIVQGGCDSGAYMPAVTYHEALATMNEHGDDVLDYIESVQGEIPDISFHYSWAGLAVHFLSLAVELWASQAAEEVEEALTASD